MSEYLAGLFGIKKKKTESTTPPTETAFTSYLEKPPEMDGFVVIGDARQPTANTSTHSSKPDSDYEHLYSFLGQTGNPGAWNNMGAIPFKNGCHSNQPNSRQQSAVINVQPFSPYQTVPSPATVQFTSQESYDSSFLSDVPFKLSPLFETAHSLQTDQLSDTYNFLSMKASMLEVLNYNFNLEHDVLQESEDMTN